MATTFKKNIVKELGLENLPEDRKMEILLGIGRIIQQNVILRILDKLPEEDKKDFDKLLEKKGDKEEEILKFLQKKIPSLDKIVNEEIEKFKTESVDFLSNVTK